MFGTIAGVILVPVGLLALYTAPALAHDHVIKERINLMRKGGLGNFKVIKAFVTDSKRAMADGCDFFAEGSPKGGDANQSNEWKRRAYIARALAHFRERRTLRNIFWAIDTSQELVGNPEGPGGKIPGLTPATRTASLPGPRAISWNIYQAE